MIKKARFTISIDDGFGEYSYKVRLDENCSIDTIATFICRALRVRKPKSHLRKEGEPA